MSLSDFFNRLIRKHPPLGEWLNAARDIRPLASPSGHSWVVEGEEENLVLRVPGRRPPGADWAAEGHALELLSRRELVPSPLYQAHEDGVLLRPWVHGELPSEPGDVERSVRHLAVVNRLPIQGLRCLEFDLRSLREIPLAGAESVARQFEEVAPCPELGFCHNDPNPGNFILGPDRDWLLDWEYVGANDPLRDLAYLAAWDPDPLDPPYWLNLYGYPVKEGAVARFEYGVALSDALSCDWWHQTGGEVPRWRWERLREATSSPRWAGTVRLAGIPPSETEPVPSP